MYVNILSQKSQAKCYYLGAATDYRWKTTEAKSEIRGDYCLCTEVSQYKNQDKLTFHGHWLYAAHGEYLYSVFQNKLKFREKRYAQNT